MSQIETRQFDAIQLGILWSKMRAIADEAAANVVKTAVSTSVGISQDFACSILDARGRLLACGVPSVAQFSALLPRTMRMVLERFPVDDWEPGDVVLTTDPWVSAGHAYDLVLISPAFADDKLVAFTVSLAHTADIGGTLALSGSKDMFEEGLILPLLKIYKTGQLNEDVLEVLKANIRVPDVMMGDFHAMTAANELAARRLVEVLREYGMPDYVELTDEIEAYSERAVRAAIAKLPDGSYPFELDIDGIKRPVHLAVTVTVRGDELTVDFTGSDEQRPDEALNAVLNFTFSETVTAVQSVLTPNVSFNEGFLRAVEVIAPEGSVYNCTKPVPVKNRDKVVAHIETLIFGALHPILPDKVLATSGGINVTVANGIDSTTGRVFNTYVSQGGGTGAGLGYDGVHCLHFPWGSRSIPVEMVESRSPLLVKSKRITPDSGGAGRYRGGCGQETVITTLPEQTRSVALALYSDHIRFAPEGLAGGEPGQAGDYLLDGEALGADHEAVVNSFIYLEPESELTVRLPGGGGYGDPAERDPEAIEADLRAGFVTPEGVRRSYVRSPERP
jgi:N-methylhydantoinase B/oxoprolinase/acetone carboxylase alpha subunit